MDDELIKKFLEEASTIRLTAGEHKDLRSDMRAFIAGKDVKQMEAEAKAFFNDVADIGLQKEEVQVGRADIETFMRRNPVQARARIFRRRTHSHPVLSKTEKHRFRNRLEGFMNVNKLPQNREFIPAQELKPSWAELLLQSVLPRTVVLGCAFLIVGSGVAYAAEDAVPGDFLYPLKVDIVEQIRTRLTFSEQEKAKWEGTRALRRLEEVEQLSATDELTHDTLVRLQGSFEKHVEDAERHIDSVADTGDIQTAQQLSGDLEVFLRAHHSVMDTLSQERKSNADLRDAIGKVREGILKKTKEKYSPVQTADEPGREKTTAEVNIGEAVRAIKTQRSHDKEEPETAAHDTLNKADELLEKAHIQMGEGSFDQASSLAREAVKFAEEAKILRKLPVRLPKKLQDSTPDQSSSASSAMSSQADASSVSSQSIPVVELPDIEIHIDLPAEVKIPGL